MEMGREDEEAIPGARLELHGQIFTDKSNGRSAIGIDSFDCKSLRTLFQFLPYVFCEDPEARPEFRVGDKLRGTRVM